MRKNAPRKWLHAALDLLPVIIIPVFMIFSHRHDVAQDITYTEDVAVYYETNEVASYSDLHIGNSYQYTYNSSLSGSNALYLYVHNDELLRKQLVNVNQNEKVLIRLLNNNLMYTTYDINDQYINRWTIDFPFTFVIDSYDTQFALIEDIINNFKSYSTYFKEYQQVTTVIPQSVMDSFVNQFNFTVDKYFNMGNVFNLTGVYNWFNTNIFNGNAPQVVYSVWNIALYEFVMDLLFLLYALFMFFIDFCTSLIERCYVSGKGGK